MKSSVDSLVFTENFYDISKRIFCGDLEFSSTLHPRLAVAIEYLAGNYLYDISQSTLANKSCISASHLAFLFRSQLKMRFKELLVQLRLLYALSLLDEDPRILITDLCLQAGFGDLSHFEKMFRRYTGLSPREIRSYVMRCQRERQQHERKQTVPMTREYIDSAVEPA